MSVTEPRIQFDIIKDMRRRAFGLFAYASRVAIRQGNGVTAGGTFRVDATVSHEAIGTTDFSGTEPMMWLEEDQCTQLMDELWSAGFRPTDDDRTHLKERIKDRDLEIDRLHSVLKQAMITIGAQGGLTDEQLEWMRELRPAPDLPSAPVDKVES